MITTLYWSWSHPAIQVYGHLPARPSYTDGYQPSETHRLQRGTRLTERVVPSLILSCLREAPFLIMPSLVVTPRHPSLRPSADSSQPHGVGTSPLQPTDYRLVPDSLKKWYPRGLLPTLGLTCPTQSVVSRATNGSPIRSHRSNSRPTTRTRWAGVLIVDSCEDWGTLWANSCQCPV